MPAADNTLARYVESWSPEPFVDEGVLDAAPVAALSAVLDLAETVAADGEPLPPLWHWLYLLRWPAQRDLGPDGHPRAGHFLPPVPDRRRMIAGGRCDIREPLTVGEPARRVSSLKAVVPKSGATGDLLFVTVRNEYSQHGTLRLTEQQDVVYRSGRSDRTYPAVLDYESVPGCEEPWQRALHPDAVMLFRFSALTANAHRIHYDHPYATGEEGYPGVVVHGPLIVIAMLELARVNVPRRRVSSVSYRLRHPAFAGEHLLASGVAASDGAALRLASARERRHATAEVTFA